MKLSEEIKEKIKTEHKQWMDTQYAGKSLKERQKLGAFFTPPELAIEMIEKFDNLDGDIFDPCCGSGNLLAACAIAGAKPTNLYGNEIDPEILKICRIRLKKLDIPESHIKQGDATKDDVWFKTLSRNRRY